MKVHKTVAAGGFRRGGLLVAAAVSDGLHPALYGESNVTPLFQRVEAGALSLAV